MQEKEIILSDAQKKILELNYGKHVVLAPPGSGKTELLAQRVIYALQRGLIPNQIVALTFTNRAAINMNEKVEAKLGKEVKPFIGNFHAFAERFLRRYKLLEDAFTVIDEDDAKSLMFEACGYFRENSDDTMVLNASNANRMFKLDEAGFVSKSDSNFAATRNFNPNMYIEISEKYEQIKSESMVYDYDDLLTTTYKHLKKNPNNITFRKYDWIEIDEAQDLNELQWALVNLIATDNAHVVIFADLDQAIYSFMGAEITEFVNHTAGAETHYLLENFRSPEHLLNLYNRYIARNFNLNYPQLPKAHSTLKGVKEDLQILEFMGDELKERKYIVEKLLPELFKNDQNKTAIFFKYNKSADFFSAVLDSKKIEYFKVSGFEIFHYKLIKDIFSVIKVLQFPNSHFIWSRIFRLFAGIETLKQSRNIVNESVAAGFSPGLILENDDLNLDALSNYKKDIMNKRVVVFDTETTGIDVGTNDIIQISAIEIIAGVKGREFDIYLQSDKLSPEAEKIHHISSDFIATNGKDRSEGISEFLDFVGSSPIIAHNMEYDYSIMLKNLIDLGIDTSHFKSLVKYDTLTLSRSIFQRLSSYKLKSLITEFGLPGTNTHNALDDVRATVDLAIHLANNIDDKTDNRAEVLQRYSSYYLKLRDNFGEFRKEAIDNMSTETSIAELFQKVYKFLIDSGNIYDSQNEKAFQKLYRHAEYFAVKKSLRTILNEDFYRYSRMKEADLVLGSEKVFLSTIHRAKGLEFDNVIIPDCSNNAFPSYMTKTPKQLEEEKRVLYVALTRAKKRIYITFHAEDRYGRKLKLTTFLAELTYLFECKKIKSPTLNIL